MTELKDLMKDLQKCSNNQNKNIKTIKKVNNFLFFEK